MELAKIQHTFALPRFQDFCFPSEVITYLWKNPLSADGLLKLYKTCKYFYSKQKILIIHRMKYSEKELKLGKPSNAKDFKLQTTPLWIGKSLSIYHSKSWKLDNIYRFSMKSLSIYHSNLLLKDFEILLAENTVTSLYFYDSGILYSNGKNVTIDVILQKMPNVVKLFYKNDRERYSNETLEKMNAIKFKNKFLELSLDLKYLSDTFDPFLLCDFIRQNGRSPSKIVLFVYDSYLNDLILTLKASLESLLDSWVGEKPSFELK